MPGWVALLTGFRIYQQGLMMTQASPDHARTAIGVGRVILLASLALTLAACSPAVVGGVVAADVVTLNTTRKTLADHVVSSATGQNCSTISMQETGVYCPQELVVDRSGVHCYRTLGDVECYAIPDPYRNHNQQLGSEPAPVHVVPRPRGWMDRAGEKMRDVVTDMKSGNGQQAPQRMTDASSPMEPGGTY